MSDYSEFAGDGDQEQNFDFAPAAAPVEGSADPSQPQVRGFEDVYRDAFVAYANTTKLRQDSDHDIVENPDLIQISKAEAFDFLYRIGQPDAQATFVLDQEDYTCNDLYDAICDYGIDTQPTTEKLATLLGIVQLVTGMSKAFINKNARGKKGEVTKIVLGEVVGAGKSSIRTELSSQLSPADSATFSSNPGAFFVTEATLELNNAQAKQWCKDIISHAVNIISITSRQFLGANVAIEFQDPSPTLLTIKFIGSDVDQVTKDNLILVLTDLANILFPIGFTTEWKWAVSFDEILDIPLPQLLQSEVSMSLPALGIEPSHLANLRDLIPVEMLGAASLDELLQKIPGLEEVLNGNLATTIDLRQFITKILAQWLGGEEKVQTYTLINIISDWAPLGFSLLSPFLSKSLTLTDVISAMASLVALARLIFARDFSNFISFRAVCQSGHSFSFESANVFKVESLFKALDTVFEKLTKVAEELPKDQ